MHTQKCVAHKSGKPMVTGRVLTHSFPAFFLSKCFNLAIICLKNESDFQT